ncbi:competence/damage-inducible protein A [Labrys monachus]|uniref:Molybdenum cofactor synthesis domain-containing protein n=1 Tax=Labrys monachus TaxID=217067 RepID=A0ABU0FIV3_9HYPH|nr:competence/damage-inducible protein A [Labrys monachus]MDQ0393990.1 molybdenum cofactor synthesis domain-containing protein [Labrys monachus]
MESSGQSSSATVRAAILVIGDEILSGRTKDKNIGYIAEFLTGVGIDVKEVRVVPDEEDRIIEALDALRGRYDYVFTTGGIGPTHDDITADAVAKAFGVAIDVDPRAVAVMTAHYGGSEHLTPARLRMARIPAGAELVDNPVSAAPGFMLGNVVVMAGVPHIMQRMLDNAALKLRTGSVTLSDSVSPGPGIGEGMIAEPLAAIAAGHPEVSIGSYPSFGPAGFQTQLVIRGKDAAKVAAAKADIEAMVTGLRR